MYRNFLLVVLATLNFSYAEFLVQASFGQQLSQSIVRMSGYQVSYNNDERSPYDIGVGYILNLKDILVMPVVFETNPATLPSVYDQDAMTDLIKSPLELHLKPGIKVDDYQFNAVVGFDLGQFEQQLDCDVHAFKLGLIPSFYGAGFSRSLSEYLDYFAELKVYYHSQLPYAMSLETRSLDESLSIVDTVYRLGLRVRV
ncbi:hypothetical protein OAT84_02480 [Gammaproteobacteria bacterium]|nr:hypothetical protein [Gammaproteobacteria bacterium]